MTAKQTNIKKKLLLQLNREAYILFLKWTPFPVIPQNQEECLKRFYYLVVLEVNSIYTIFPQGHVQFH